jgi:cell fate regulator YaaT (PSP1 superfamily)
MQTATIRLRKPTRVYSFICTDVELKRHEPCVVKSDRGLEFGICITPPEPCAEDVRERVTMEVVRRATERDEADFERLQQEELEARTICKEKINAHRLPMKLVDAEYTLDKNKITFYFTAAERVDFRQLVRDLAQSLKTRIELRHIQVRDEAKITGGIGVCGRELCCSTWLTDFKPISMKMAKRQNLSLNPSKISGQCGRLLCCLEYENEQYSKRSKAQAEAEAARRAAEASQAEGEEGDAPAVKAAPEQQETPKAASPEQDAQEAAAEADAKDQEEAGGGNGQQRKGKSRRKRRRKKPRSSGDGNDK